MPNYVRNKLEIHCENETIMDKIKMIVFDEDENKNKVFTLQKMLPRPEKFSSQKGYSDYGYDWSRAFWGTKWDITDYNICESGNTITLFYSTAWSTNDNWVESLCLYIQKTLPNGVSENPIAVSIIHRFYDIVGSFGGIMEWVPGIRPDYKVYSVMEYAKLHDQKLYHVLLLLEEKNKSGNDDIIVIKGV